MSDYYDRLEQQLMHATARARRVRMAPWRPRRDVVAVAAALAVAAGVVAIFVGLRPSARPIEHLPSQHRLAVVHNYVNGAPPALGGASSCATRLAPPQVDPSKAPAPWKCYITHVSGRAAALRGPGATGRVIVNLKPPSGDVFSIDASGLRPSPRHGDYAVWLLSGHTTAGACSPHRCPPDYYRLVSGRQPAFAGIVTPPVGASGRLRADGLIPALSARQATGSYLFVITRQSHPSNRSLGRIVLEGWLSF